MYFNILTAIEVNYDNVVVITPSSLTNTEIEKRY